MNPRPNAMPARWALIVTVLLCTACTRSDNPADPPESDPDLPVMELQNMDDPNRNEGERGSSSMGSPDEPIETARTDLATRLSVEADSVELVEHRRVTWRNGALGCPEPGMAYTQALVPGYWIRLQVGTDQFDYHGARGQDPFLCPSDRAESPLPPDDNPEV